MDGSNNHTIIKFPSSRLFTIDVGKIGLQKHHAKALIEIDVTESRNKLKKIKTEPGRKISFTSWILKCIAHAASEHKQVHALRKGKNGLVLFDSVDISVVVEKKVEGMPVPIPLVIRNVESKSIDEIYIEIEKAKRFEIKNEKGYVIENNRKRIPIKMFSRMPGFLRLFIWKIILSNPFMMKSLMGTIVVTSLGMIRKISGWIIPFGIHPLCFAIGSIIEKPGVVKKKIKVREFLEISILIDHDVIDGAPAARFVSRLSELIRNGHGLF